jgi:signal transduction histidine kinase
MSNDQDTATSPLEPRPDRGGPQTESETSIRPFRLVSYFTYAGFIVMLVFALALSLLISQQTRSRLSAQSEEYARLAARLMSREISQQFVRTVLLFYSRSSLRDAYQYELMDKIVRRSIQGFHIKRVNIYDFDGMIIYSTDPKLVQTEGQDSQAYKAAIIGKSASTLITLPSGQPSLLGLTKQTRILQTFSPIWRELIDGSEGYIMGVFEIHQDLTADLAEINRFQYLSILTSVLAMTLLFMILRQIVMRADSILEKRNMEHQRLLEQLHQSERLAGLGQMVAAVSHEIRNPLGIISSSAEMLERRIKQYEPDNRLPDVIIEESRRMNGILTEFLDFARPQAPELAPVHLPDILDKNLNALSPLIEQNHVQIVRRYGGPAMVEADPDLLYRAFLNVFNNALQAMPEGGEVLVSTSGVEGANGDQAQVVIEDSGEGILPEALPRVFDPFFTTKIKGSGLGLAIVRNIIHNHQGEVFIEPAGGRGTRVVIRLPVHPA